MKKFNKFKITKDLLQEADNGELIDLQKLKMYTNNSFAIQKKFCELSNYTNRFIIKNNNITLKKCFQNTEKFFKVENFIVLKNKRPMQVMLKLAKLSENKQPNIIIAYKYYTRIIKQINCEVFCSTNDHKELRLIVNGKIIGFLMPLYNY